MRCENRPSDPKIPTAVQIAPVFAILDPNTKRQEQVKVYNIVSMKLAPASMGTSNTSLLGVSPKPLKGLTKKLFLI